MLLLLASQTSQEQSAHVLPEECGRHEAGVWCPTFLCDSGGCLCCADLQIVPMDENGRLREAFNCRMEELYVVSIAFLAGELS